MLPYLESLRTAGEMELLSQVVHAIAERVYTSTDRRTLSSVSDANGDTKTAGAPKQKLGWPGVSCEVWGAEGAYGGEGYGWGAVLPAHIIRNLIGFRDPDSPNELRLAPNLPESFMAAGKIYRVRNLQYAEKLLHLGIHVLDSRRIRVEGSFPGSLRIISVKEASGKSIVLQGTGSAWQFEGVNRQEYLVRVAGI